MSEAEIWDEEDEESSGRQYVAYADNHRKEAPPTGNPRDNRGKDTRPNTRFPPPPPPPTTTQNYQLKPFTSRGGDSTPELGRQPSTKTPGMIDVVWGGQRPQLIPSSWTPDQTKAFKSSWINFHIIDELLGSPSAKECSRIRPLKPYKEGTAPLQRTGEQNPPCVFDEASNRKIWPANACSFCHCTPDPPPDCSLPMHQQYKFGWYQANHASSKCFATKLNILYSKDEKIRRAFSPPELAAIKGPPRQ